MYYASSNNYYFYRRIKNILGFWHVDAIVEHFNWSAAFLEVFIETKAPMRLIVSQRLSSKKRRKPKQKIWNVR